MLSIPRAPLIFKLRITTWAFEIKGGQGALMFCRWLFGESPPLISYFAMEVNCRQLKGELKGDSDFQFFHCQTKFLILSEKLPMSAQYNKNLKPLARNLRKFGTKGEALLWRDALKAKQHWPYQFNRQFIIGDYIVDFICRKLKLIIEIDGSSHIAKSEEDFKRQNFLESLGFTVLRFAESLVVYRIDDVVAEIDYAIKCLKQRIEDEKERESG